MATVPWVGWVTAVTFSVWADSLGGPLESLPSTLTVVAEASSATVVASFTASGVSLTSVTVTLTVPVAVPPLPSLMA